MTKRQRIAFFTLVGDAFHVSGFGTDREAWRKQEMQVAIPECDSISKVNTNARYETMMMHFAQLAQDARTIRLYADASERRYRHVLQAIEADLGFLRGHGCDDAYMAGIYRKSGGPDYADINDIPEDKLSLVVQIADSFVRSLRQKAKLSIRDLPSSGAPWFIRGSNPGERTD